MSTRIGSVVIDIDARLTSLEANLAKANRQFSRFDRDMRKTGGQIEASFTRLNGVVLNFVKGLGAGLVAGALSGGAKSLLNFADDLATAADQANISVERFQTLRGAFRSLEIDGDVYEKLLQKLIVAQGEVASGAENATTKALDKLGISAKILSGEITTTDGFIDALAVSLGDIEDPAQKAAIAAEIVSKRYGTQLAAALGDGGVALHQAEVDFTNAGKVIDDVMIQKLAAANETWDGFVENIQSKSVIMAASVIDAFGKIQDAYLKWGAEFVLDNTWLYDEEKQQIAQDILIKQHRAYLDKLAADQKRVADKLASVKLPALDWLNPKNPIVLDPDPDPKRTRTTPTKPTFSPADLRLGNDLPPAMTPLSIDLEKPLVDIDKLAVGFEGLKQRIGATDIALAEVFDAELVERMEYVREQGINTIGDALEDLAFEGGKNIDDLAKWFVRLAIRMEVIEPLLDSLRAKSEALAAAGQGGGGILGALFKLGSSLIGGGGSSVDTSFLSGLGDRVNDYTGRGFASGGRPPVGKWSIVGERGPELFQPDVAGRILPNDVFANMGGGGDVNSVTINAPGATAETVQMIRRELVNALPIFQKASFAYTQNRLARNRFALARGLG